MPDTGPHVSGWYIGIFDDIVKLDRIIESKSGRESFPVTVSLGEKPALYSFSSVEEVAETRDYLYGIVNEKANLVRPLYHGFTASAEDDLIVRRGHKAGGGSRVAEA